MIRYYVNCFVFFSDTATTEIYTLSLHDALPISCGDRSAVTTRTASPSSSSSTPSSRSEEHTSELQSLAYLVCRLLLENNQRRWSVDALLARPRVPPASPSIGTPP